MDSQAISSADGCAMPDQTLRDSEAGPLSHTEHELRSLRSDEVDSTPLRLLQSSRPAEGNDTASGVVEVGQRDDLNPPTSGPTTFLNPGTDDEAAVLEEAASHVNSPKGEEQDSLGPGHDAPAATSAAEPTKKKKKKKGSGKNRKPNPTGFEEFYADPPMTPDEYNEEVQVIYHSFVSLLIDEDLLIPFSSRSFLERIEQCIRRYRARRKLDEVRGNIFTKYMTLGGVDTGLKMFTGGMERDVLEDMNASEILAMNATDRVGGGQMNSKFYDPANNANWVVDFEAITKGFLSNKAPRVFGAESQEEISGYCGVVRNFLNYVLSHNVCPEYSDNVLAARQVCDRAEKELWLIHQAGALLPGPFNRAASTIYGGYYKGLYTDASETWFSELTPAATGMTEASAQRIFCTAVSLVGSGAHFDALLTNSPPCRVVASTTRSLEVVAITFAPSEIAALYSGAKGVNGDTSSLQALGKLEVQHWDNPEADNEDLTAEEEAELKQNGPAKLPNEIFWVEDEILQYCFVGMKFEATVRELNIGIKYFDTVTGIYCSFFKFLPNQRLDGWKEPVPNPRRPPTVDNIDGGDEAGEDGADE